MDTVFTDSENIVITLKQTDINPSIDDETAIMEEEPMLIKAKRFGVVDLWKIHSGKRYANVYPHRLR